MARKVFYSNKAAVQDKIQRLKQAGATKLQIVSDFDRTLTEATVDGKTHSTFAVLWDYIPKANYERGQELFRKYYPIERSADISIEDKIPLMMEWWQLAMENFVDAGLSREVMERIVTENKLRMRAGIDEFFAIRDEYKVPLLILSSGQGDMIRFTLGVNSWNKEGVYIMSNYATFGNDGKIKGFSSDIIHTYNKRQRTVQDKRYKREISGRSNVFLLGDTLGDADMVDDKIYDTVLKIGFLNENIDELRRPYSAKFDIVILTESDMTFINDLFSEILQ